MIMQIGYRYPENKMSKSNFKSVFIETSNE